MRALATLASCLLLSNLAVGQDLFGIPLKHGSAIRGIGDLNGDGHMDGIIAGAGATIGAFLNDGKAQFTSGPLLDLGSDGLLNLVYPSVGDWNGDGLADVVVPVHIAHPLGRGFLIATSDGTGSFNPPVHVGVPGNFSHVSLGNVDGDNRADIACCGYSGGGMSDVYLISNQLFGTVVSSPFALSFEATGIALGDLDGDGLDELIIGEALPGNVHVFNIVGGALVAGATYPVLNGTGSNTAEVLVGDMDQDGDSDILSVNSDGAQAWITLLDNAGGGLLTPAPGSMFSQFAAELSTRNHSLGDWDHDGDLDLMGQGGSFFTSNYRARWVENLGGGNFAYSFSVQFTSGGIPGGAADFNGDGHLDYMTNQHLVFGDGALVPPLLGDLPISERFSFALDTEDDGDLDLLDFFRSANNDIFRLENDGAGGLTRSDVLLADPAAPQFNFGFPATFADFDGDGLGEIVLSVTQVINGQPFHLATRRFVDDGTGFFVDDGNAAPLGIELPLNSDLLVDFDSDGDLDSLSGGDLWSNDGDGFFARSQMIVDGSILDAADVDADGDMDLLTSKLVGNQVEVRLERHNGTLGFTRELLFSVPVGHYLRLGRLEDLDDDGDRDLLIVTTLGQINPPMRVITAEQQGGVFALAQVDEVFGVPGAGTPIASVGDVDGDGSSDLCIGIVTTNFIGANTIYVLRRLSASLDYEAPKSYLANGIRSIDDIDGDGDLDLLGTSIHLSRGFEGPDVGSIQQFGNGTAGTAGALPVLGSTGPLRPGTQAELRVRRALGGSVVLVARGLNAVNLADTPFVGLTMFVSPTIVFAVDVLSGPAGAFAQGEWAQSSVLPSGLAGQTFHFQAFVLDGAGPSGLSASNGLTIQVGS